VIPKEKNNFKVVRTTGGFIKIIKLNLRD